jgi:hypothetical protein
LHNKELQNLFSLCYHYTDLTKENEVGGTCGTYGRGEKSVQGFGGENAREKDHAENPRPGWEDGTRIDVREFGWTV